MLLWLAQILRRKITTCVVVVGPNLKTEDNHVCCGWPESSVTLRLKPIFQLRVLDRTFYKTERNIRTLIKLIFPSHNLFYSLLSLSLFFLSIPSLLYFPFFYRSFHYFSLSFSLPDSLTLSFPSLLF